jgi:hypothetical protein
MHTDHPFWAPRHMNAEIPEAEQLGGSSATDVTSGYHHT